MFLLLKIFGLASIGLVLMLSFFNDRRANNSGEDETFRMTDASRIFFNNIRRTYYNVEAQPDAMLDIHRLKKQVNLSSDFGIYLDLIINRKKNTAFLYLEPYGILKERENLPIRWQNPSGTYIDSMVFSGGDRFSHLSFAQQLHAVLEDGHLVEVNVQNDWLRIFDLEVERDAFLSTYNDFRQLVRKH